MAKKKIVRTRYPLEDNIKRALFIRPGTGGGGEPGILEIPYATRAETDAGTLTDKVVNPDTGGYAYDRFRYPGQHSAGKGTATITSAAVDGSIPIDCRRSNVFRTTLTGDSTLGNPSGGLRGQTINISVFQDSVGGHTLDFGDAYLWVLGVTPEVSSAANAADLISCQYSEALGKWLCVYLPDFTGTGTGWGSYAVGPAGPQGPAGEAGPPGAAGSGVPSGGTTGQALVKASATDGDVTWDDFPSTPTALEVTFDNTGTGLVAANVQAALVELDGAEIFGIPQASSYETWVYPEDDGHHKYNPVAAAAIEFILPNTYDVPLSVGHATTFVNLSVNDLTITCEDGTITYLPSGDSGTSCVVPENAVATVLKVATETWIVTGPNLTVA